MHRLVVFVVLLGVLASVAGAETITSTALPGESDAGGWISPDGGTVAVLRYPGQASRFAAPEWYDLHFVDPATHADRTVQSEAVWSAYYPYAGGWTPDGSEFVFSDSARIKAFPRDGSTARTIVESASLGRSSQPISPDGHWLVFSASDGLDIAHLDGSDRTTLVPGVDEDFRSYSNAASAAFSPDGRQIAFFAGTSLDLVDADGSGLRTLGPASVNGGPGGIIGPTWSPDGRWIAYDLHEADVMQPFEQGLWVVHPDGSGAHRIAVIVAAVSFVAWSADSSGIVVPQRDGYQLVPVAAGSPPRQLTSTTELAGFSATSPDGRTILVGSTVPGCDRGGVAELDLASGALRQLTIDCHLVGTPAADTINGSPAADVIVALGGNDTIYGHTGNDTIDGGNGNDVIHGGAGSDTIDAGPGHDIVYTDAGADIVDTVDGMRDIVDCSNSYRRATVYADRVDVLRGGCGIVHRRR